MGIVPCVCVSILVLTVSGGGDVTGDVTWGTVGVSADVVGALVLSSTNFPI